MPREYDFNCFERKCSECEFFDTKGGVARCLIIEMRKKAKQMKIDEVGK